ncbi:MAG: glycerate kinase [Prevotellaceae bacterium]|jgi:glycerate kinase|nr:glycerate kinase [Prevotellaceae bacterium]
MKHIDTDQAKAQLINEYVAAGKRSEQEVTAFHSGLNYLIDYLEESKKENGLNEYIPPEVVYGEQSNRAIIGLMKKEMEQLEEEKQLLKVDNDALKNTCKQLKEEKEHLREEAHKKLQETIAIKMPKYRLFKEQEDGTPKHILVLMDSFKGSLSSKKAGEAVADSVRKVLPQAEVTAFPIADGGEGTVDAFLAAEGGNRRFITVHGPLMEPLDTSYGISTDGQTACIETAAICGLPLVPQRSRNPLNTTTLGVGEAIVDALNHGCRKIIIGLGGSATNDAGTGTLQALGYRFLDKEQKELGPGCGKMLEDIMYVDDTQLNPLVREAKFHVLCDVDNPLLGIYGAVAVYAPQKGATTPAQMKKLEAGLTHFHNITKRYTGIVKSNARYTGAAGGMAYGLRNYLEANAHQGYDYLRDNNPALREELKLADLIITGEGRADRQTLMGKAPIRILLEGNERRTPVILIAGSVADEYILDEAGFIAIFSTTPSPTLLKTVMEPSVAERNLRRTAMQVVQTYFHTPYTTRQEKTTNNPPNNPPQPDEEHNEEDKE